MTNAHISLTGTKKQPYKLALGSKLAYVLRKYHNYKCTVWIFKTYDEAYKSYLYDIELANRSSYSKGKFEVDDISVDSKIDR